MGKISGFSQYICDRCKTAVFFSGTEIDAQRWRTIRRVDALGVEETRLLCPDCAEKYGEIIEQQDMEFRKFLGRKKSVSDEPKAKGA